MRNILLALLVALPALIFCQTTIPADKASIPYCEAFFFKSGVSEFTVSIEFEKSQAVRLKDAENKDRVFETLPGFLTWMEEQGWAFFQYDPYIDPLEKELKLFQKIVFKKK